MIPKPSGGRCVRPARTCGPKDAIAGVGVVITTQRWTTIALDKHGLPLRPAMIWLDQRRASQLPRLA